MARPTAELGGGGAGAPARAPGGGAGAPTRAPGGGAGAPARARGWDARASARAGAGRRAAGLRRSALLPGALLAGLAPGALAQGSAEPYPVASAEPAATRSLAYLLPGPDGLALRALLVLPAAPGPPAVPVIALHGCGGIGGPEGPIRLPRRERDWAARLVALGHPVLFPDSFGSRGIAETCRGGDAAAMPETARRQDVHAAASWAVEQPWAAGREAGVFLLGWSHGGSTALAAAGAPVPPGLIRAAIALYPGCRRMGQALPDWAPAAPVLLLLGGMDDWTPARWCQALAARAAGPGGPPITVHTYPGAWHGFDQPAMPLRVLSGLPLVRGGEAHIGTDPAARADALVRVPEFLAAHAQDRPPR